MSFEQFIPVKNGVSNNKDTYSIQAGKKSSTGYFTGSVYFNGKMRDKLNINNFRYVELYTDHEAKLIAVKFTNTKSEGTRVIRKNGSTRFITCSPWIYTATKDFGYPEKGSGQYETVGELVVLHTPTEDKTSE